MAKQMLCTPEEVQLSNGITVLFQNYDGPVAASYWWNQVGSSDERPSEAGFAHFLEHMLFKDTSAKETGRSSEGQLARAIESWGGDINAYTSFDQTVYHVTCAEQHWEKVLDRFGVMAKPQKFLKKDFENEREVILEELRKNEDSPDRQLFQTLFSSTFKKHPYGRPVIGFEKILKQAKVQNLEAFYFNNYVPERMGIIAVGPLNEARKKSLLRILEKRFGSAVIKRSKKSHPRILRPTDAPLANKAVLAARTFDVNAPSVALSMRVPRVDHPDTPSLDLLSGVLGNGETSRLYQQLFYQKSLVTEVSAGLYVPSDPGMLYVQAEYDSTEKTTEVLEALFSEVNRIRTEGPTTEELERVIVNSESERLYSSQTADGIASRLGTLRFVMGDLNFDRTYIEALRQADGESLREIANEYFDHRRMSLVLLNPKKAANPDLKQCQALIEKHFKAKPQEPVTGKKTVTKTKETKNYSLPVELIQRPSGIRVAYLKRRGSHCFSIHASLLGGLRAEIANPIFEAQKDWGLSYSLAQTWNKGTTLHSAQEIAAYIEGKAASLEGFSGRNSLGLQLTGLARDWKTLAPMLSEIITSPQFSPAEIAHTRRLVEDGIKSVEDHTSQLCSKLFLETLFEHHPYGKSIYGSLESIHTFDHNKFQTYHSHWVRPKNLILSVSGNIQEKDLDHWLEPLEKEMHAMEKRAKLGESSHPIQVAEEPALKAPRWVEKNLGREQVHIIVGGIGTNIYSKDRYALRILSNILGGQSGRLFIELREKKSLAYSVSPISFEGIEPGYIGTYIACSPQKKDEAVAGIRKVLETLATKGPSKQELDRAKEFYLGHRAMELQGDSSLASHFGMELLYGISPKNDSELTDNIRAVTGKQVQDVCKKYMLEPHMVTCSVG